MWGNLPIFNVGEPMLYSPGYQVRTADVTKLSRRMHSFDHALNESTHRSIDRYNLQQAEAVHDASLAHESVRVAEAALESARDFVLQTAGSLGIPANVTWLIPSMADIVEAREHEDVVAYIRSYIEVRY